MPQKVKLRPPLFFDKCKLMKQIRAPIKPIIFMVIALHSIVAVSQLHDFYVFHLWILKIICKFTFHLNVLQLIQVKATIVPNLQ